MSQTRTQICVRFVITVQLRTQVASAPVAGRFQVFAHVHLYTDMRFLILVSGDTVQ